MVRVSMHGAPKKTGGAPPVSRFGVGLIWLDPLTNSIPVYPRA